MSIQSHFAVRKAQARGSVVFLSLVALGALTGEVIGGRPLSDYDFSLRFPAATSRFASYPDVAALGGAQAGSEWSSSLNPASAAWLQGTRPLKHSVAAQYSMIQFAEGTRLDVYTEAPVIDAGSWGVFLPAAAQIRSNQATMRKGPGGPEGRGYDFEANYFQLQWGKRVQERWAVGALVSVTSSETRLDQAGLEVADSRAEAYTFRVGFVHQALPKLRTGTVLEYAAAPTRTRILDFDPVTFTPLWIHSSDTTHQILLRTGITWEYAKGCDFYVDYHGGVFWDDSGELWVHRFPVGIEQTILPDILFGRVGATFDTRGSVALTAGLGVSLSTRISFDLAYQRGAFPEIRPEFGAADTFVFSLAFGF
jgi:hypothetical protein